MKENTFLFLVICCIGLVQSQSSFARATPKNDGEDSRLELQKATHKFLFEEFTEGKKCVWNEDKSRLIEVRLAENQVVTPGEDFPFPDRTAEVFEFFDVLVLRSDSDLNVIKSVSLIDDSNHKIILKKFGFREGTMLYRLPKKFDRKSQLSMGAIRFMRQLVHRKTSFQLVLLA